MALAKGMSLAEMAKHRPPVVILLFPSYSRKSTTPSINSIPYHFLHPKPKPTVEEPESPPPSSRPGGGKGRHFLICAFLLSHQQSGFSNHNLKSFRMYMHDIWKPRT
jgi:hypothetical protein